MDRWYYNKRSNLSWLFAKLKEYSFTISYHPVTSRDSIYNNHLNKVGLVNDTLYLNLPNGSSAGWNLVPVNPSTKTINFSLSSDV